MKQKFGKSFVLVPIGLFFIALSLILARAIALPDVIRGLSMGVGIGLMLLAFILPKVRSAYHR